MKTVLITVFHGHIARNMLRTGIVRDVAAKGVRVVVTCPDFKREFYEKEYGAPNVVFVGVPAFVPSRVDSFFRGLQYFFVDSETVKLIQGEFLWMKKRYVRYFVERLLTKIFGNSRILRKFVRHLDYRFVRDTHFGWIFEKYKPDLVFASSITSDVDSMVMRGAKEKGIKTIAMVRSWDNFSVNKGNLRIYPEKLLVHNMYLAEDALRYADMKEDAIVYVGMPHFDYYINEPRMSREETCKKLGCEPSKKIIFFLMIGLSSGDLDAYVVRKLENMIATDEEFKNCVLVVRPHPNSDKKVDFTSSLTLVNYPKMDIIGTDKRLTDREFTKDDMDLYASIISHASAVVSYQGTGTIDTAALGRPVVNIAFDVSESLPYLRHMRHQYDFTHYQPIIASGGVRVVWHESDLRDAILGCMNNPDSDIEGRKKLVEEQCYKLDGRSGQRVTESILGALS